MATARINHNPHLTEVHRTLAVHQAETSRQIGVLSSGLRVNRSSDDPASLALADGIHSEVRAIAEGSRNIQQTFSLIQVADGSLNEISAMLLRMRALAMQAASSVFNNTDRQGIHSEFAQLRDEIDRIAGATTYNGRKLLVGGNSVLNPDSTAKANADETGLTDILVADAAAGIYTFVDPPGDGLLTLGNGVHTQTVAIADLLEDGAVAPRDHFPVRFDRLGIQVTITGADVARAPGQYRDGALHDQTLVVEEQGGLTFQVGPSGTSNDVSRVDIRDMRATGANLNLGDLSIVTRVDAQQTLDRLGAAIQKVTGERNRLGAFQNRLQLSLATSESVLERMIATESQIREADVAMAATRLARSQILSQAATSIAVEADADVERILSLLQ